MTLTGLVSSVPAHTRSLRTFHPTKNLRCFLPCVFPILLLGRGILHSQDDVLPAPAGFFSFLTPDFGGGTCWLQTSGEGALKCQPLPFLGILQMKAFSVSTAAEDFLCPARGFSCEVVAQHLEGERQKTAHQTFPVASGFPAPQNALEGLHLQAASSVPSSAPLRRFRHSELGRGGELPAQRLFQPRMGSPLHPQRERSCRGMGALHRASLPSSGSEARLGAAARHSARCRQRHNSLEQRFGHQLGSFGYRSA